MFYSEYGGFPPPGAHLVSEAYPLITNTKQNRKSQTKSLFFRFISSETAENGLQNKATASALTHTRHTSDIMK